MTNAMTMTVTVEGFETVRRQLSDLQAGAEAAAATLAQAAMRTKPPAPGSVEERLDALVFAHRALQKDHGLYVQISIFYPAADLEAHAFAKSKAGYKPYAQVADHKPTGGTVDFTHDGVHITVHDVKDPNALVIVEAATPPEPGEPIPPPPEEVVDQRPDFNNDDGPAF